MADDWFDERVLRCVTCGGEQFESALNEERVCRRCVEAELALIESDGSERAA